VIYRWLTVAVFAANVEGVLIGLYEWLCWLLAGCYMASFVTPCSLIVLKTLMSLCSCVITSVHSVFSWHAGRVFLSLWHVLYQTHSACVSSWNHWDVSNGTEVFLWLFQVDTSDFIDMTCLLYCHCQFIIVHKPPIFIKLCLVLPPPSSSSCTWNPLSTIYFSTSLFHVFLDRSLPLITAKSWTLHSQKMFLRLHDLWGTKLYVMLPVLSHVVPPQLRLSYVFSFVVV